MLNIAKGNMYQGWVSHTWNTVKGKCPHDCSYCYMKRFPQKELRFDEKELKTDLGHGNKIFVGSSCDMWADKIPTKWTFETVVHCCRASECNTFIFQSKNPKKYLEYGLPKNVIVGTTIETNKQFEQMGVSPIPYERAINMSYLRTLKKCKTFLTIEPIMDFDIGEFLELIIETCKPDFVNIGADSGNNHLPEPNKEKVLELIAELKKFTIVKIKDNLKRITG